MRAILCNAFEGIEAVARSLDVTSAGPDRAPRRA
jgi:hypothetical protein